MLYFPNFETFAKIEDEIRRLLPTVEEIMCPVFFRRLCAIHNPAVNAVILPQAHLPEAISDIVSQDLPDCDVILDSWKHVKG